jgi:hypothetical protein
MSESALEMYGSHLVANSQYLKDNKKVAAELAV